MKRVAGFLACVIALCSITACSPGYQGETEVLELPTGEGFADVTTPLVYFCGSLDCHGKPERNLSLYGMQGRRLDSKDVPCGAMTTDAEVTWDYRSVTGLEPEMLAAVAHDGGKNPERLTLIRKARGVEKHTGGVVFAKGTPGDVCLVDWISGNTTDLTADCHNVIPQNPRPLCVP